jgi:hypothetical protein
MPYPVGTAVVFDWPSNSYKGVWHIRAVNRTTYDLTQEGRQVRAPMHVVTDVNEFPPGTLGVDDVPAGVRYHPPGATPDNQRGNRH